MSEVSTPKAATLVVLRAALDLMRSGDDIRARAVARVGLEQGGDAPVLHALLGMLACRTSDLEDGIVHLRTALAGQPADVATRANLAQALIDCGRLDEACGIASAEASAAAHLSRRALRAGGLGPRGGLRRRSDDAVVAASRLRGA